MSVAEIAAYIGADTLGYLSREGLRAAVEGRAEPGPLEGRAPWCDACFSGEYPIRLDEHRARTRAAWRPLAVSE